MIPAIDAAAATLLPALARASLQGAIALSLAWLLHLLWKRGPARIKCWIWRFAFLKLLLALIPLSALTLPLLPAPALTLPRSTAQPTQPTPLLPTPHPLTTLVALSSPRSNIAEPPPPAPLAATPSSLSPQSLLLAVYLLGVILFLLHTLRAYHRVQTVRQLATPLQHPSLLRLNRQIATDLRLPQAPPLLTANRLCTPMLVGPFRPAILLPLQLVDTLSPEEFRLILTHELAHLKRRDLLWNWLPTIVGILFFFHPLVWLARQESALDQEIACDELTVTAASSTVATYGRTLLSVISHGRGVRRDAFAVGMSTLARTTKRRILAMRHFSPQQRSLLAPLLLALAALLVLPWTVIAQPPASQPQNLLTVSKAANAQFTTIQSAIDAAPDNATIHIAAGTYAELLTLHHPVTLEGEGWDKTIIAPTLATAADILKATGAVSGLNNGQRQERLATALKGLPMAGITVDAVGHVELRSLQLTANPGPRNETRYSPTLLQLDRTNASLRNCALLGSPGDVLAIRNGTTADIRNSLIAGTWGTGIEVGDREGRTVDVTIADSDIRNNYYAGITIAAAERVAITRCRISGSAWHGIRYDNASPSITNNRIFNNARSGIYASGRTGATITGNLFVHNEMDGISCWFGNADTITHNTFMDNLREAIIILGSSQPTLDHNLFVGHPIAIDCGAIADSSDAVGTPTLGTNLFWHNTTIKQVKNAVGKDVGTAVELDPAFTNPDAGNFSLPATSPARQQSLGVPDPLSATSPFPLQPVEQSIIPAGASRDYQLWKSAP